MNNVHCKHSQHANTVFPTQTGIHNKSTRNMRAVFFYFIKLRVNVKLEKIRQEPEANVLCCGVAALHDEVQRGALTVKLPAVSSTS